METRYNVSFRCYFGIDDGARFNTHYVPDFPLAEIGKWVECYQFTHPNCISVSCKVWLSDAPVDITDDEND